MFTAMKLSRKLGLGFGIVVALMLAYGAYSFNAYKIMATDINEIATNWLPSIKVIAQINDMAGKYRRLEFQHIISTEDADKRNFEQELEKANADLKELRQKYEPLISSPEERAIYTQFGAAWDNYLKFHTVLIGYSRKNATEQAQKLIAGESRAAFAEVQGLLAKLVSLNDKGAADQAAAGQAAYASAKLIAAFSLLLATLMAIGIAAVLIRGVMAQLGEDPGYLAEVAGKIAGGDLNVAFRPQKKQGGVYHVLPGMVATMKAKIAEAETKSAEAAEEGRRAKIAADEANEAKARAERAKAEGMMEAAGQLEKVVEVISSASEELSAQVEQSSRGAEQQSSRVAETATAMEEMNSTVLEVAKNASQAAESADAARKKAGEGSRIVAQVVDGIGTMQQVSVSLKEDMGVLGRQAEGIGQVMNVISDIADQTNLLALNAAIEAARAGDAGRGFAVVADEVRKLAEKTMAATKEVGEAIRGIQDGAKKNLENVDRAVKTVEQATGLANSSGESLTQIVGLVEAASDQVRSIATASEQQSATSEEINRSVEEINRISSETADAMRQSAQAVSELASQTQSLRGLIEKMKAGG
jgi:methyl-accepting chemotaxis protein